MQLSSGRGLASDADGEDNQPAAAIPPLPTTAATTKTAPYLPRDILHDIVYRLFQQLEPCTLRRYVVNRLLEQQHEELTGLHDRSIRCTAALLMDDAEKAIYGQVRDQVLALHLVNKDYYFSSLAAERDWLRNKPMDITAFRAFCANPGLAIAPTIVIELFTRSNFLDPPSFISELVDPNWVRVNGSDGISDTDRDMLRDRAPLRFLPPVIGEYHLGRIDDKLVIALKALFYHAMKDLPRHVTKVKVIAKLPDVGSGMCELGASPRPRRPRIASYAASGHYAKYLIGAVDYSGMLLEFGRSVTRQDVVFEGVD